MPHEVRLVWYLIKEWRSINVCGMKNIQNAPRDLLELLRGVSIHGIQMIHQGYNNLCQRIKLTQSTISFRCGELQLIDRCHQIEPRFGTIEEILLKHTRDQFDILKSTENETDKKKLEELSSHYDSVFFHPVSNADIFCPQF